MERALLLTEPLRADHAPADAAAARRVLEIEADALRALAQSLDGAFSAAVDLLMCAKGRVIVSGMGKSGHVAQKIAATFASTGTPAQFVHPAEASHGDLGMVTRADAVVLLSNSGETRELADLIEHTRRYDIPLVGIAGRAPSTLLQRSDVAIALPDAPEACPMGLAPTTSTTMMLALGDALAVALMERRGFSADDYRVLHPGGALGKRLVRVTDIMHAGDAMPLVAETAPMSEVILEMTAKTFGVTGVCDAAGRLTGIITDGDLRRHMRADLLANTAGAIMTPAPKTLRASALVPEALGFMNARKISCVFVMADGEESGRPVGLLRIHDCLQAGYS
ncbi:MAG: KpsF/GutQ family sugar-phosphate isomerase [Alphaproteobacteria bacterium]|nr:KpsF/GutQ family sugar-phosphate isomerase [Alphaproteobacteria bacterium]